MDAQELFSGGSQVSFLCAIALFVATVRYAMVHDVRGVANDLSGRRRQQRMEDSCRGAKTSRRMLSMQEDVLTEVVHGMPANPTDSETVVTEASEDADKTTWFELGQGIELCGADDGNGEGACCHA